MGSMAIATVGLRRARSNEWAQIELPAPAKVAKIVFSRDRERAVPGPDAAGLGGPALAGRQDLEDGRRGEGGEFRRPARAGGYVAPVPLPDPLTWDGLVRYAFLCERKTWQRISPADHISPLRVERPAVPGGPPYWGRIARLDPLARTLVLMEEMTGRAWRPRDSTCSEERSAVGRAAPPAGRAGGKAEPDATAEESLYLDARLAKRRLMFRDPDLAGLERILFVKRHPYLSSHNYSDILDSQFRPGGGVCVLEIPRASGRLDPADGEARHALRRQPRHRPRSDGRFRRQAGLLRLPARQEPDARQDCYWHLMAIDADGRHGRRQLTDGPFHDYYPCPLPDGGLAFISTRCRARFLCWRPQAFVLFRMDADGENIRPLSFANLSEWSPAVMRDGRILWTRSEYLDKGANFGHTLWAIHPDGTHPELIFGNDTINCYMNGREVPGSREICCTMISHGGDHNGPLGLIDLAKGPFDSGGDHQHHARRRPALRHELAGPGVLPRPDARSRATISSPATPRPTAGACTWSTATAIASCSTWTRRSAACAPRRCGRRPGRRC